MNAAVARSYWDGTGLAKLLVGFLLAPFAWLLDLETSYAAVGWACAADHREVLLLLPLLSLTLITTATWMLWSSSRMLKKHAALDGGRAEDRSYFIAVLGLGLNALFLLLILLSYAPRYFLSPCG